MLAMCVGVPGTGKSYFMVSFLKKYFEYDAFFDFYTIKEGYLILSNISGLKLFGDGCWNIESPEILGNPKKGVEGKYTREEFFTVDNMKRIMEKTGKKNIILALDEIQQQHYFPKKFDHPDVNYLWEYHRHIGMHIIFGTQNIRQVSSSVVYQAEYLAHGKLRSKKIMGGMSYRFTDNVGGYLYDKTLRTDQAVFRTYQSATTDEAVKPKNAILHWMIITIVFLVVAGGLFKTALTIVKNKANPEYTKKQVSPSAARLMQTPSAVPSSPPPSPRVPVQSQLSSVRRVPLVPVADNHQVVAINDNLPHVIGLVGDVNGKNTKYLLSTGRIATCKKQLNIGDIYIP